MWVTKLLISPVKKGFFAQKRPNLAQNWHFWSIWARPCRLIRCPVGGLVGGCGARAVSRKTPINFIQIDKIGPADYADDAANSLPRTLSLKSEHFFKIFHLCLTSTI